MASAGARGLAASQPFLATNPGRPLAELRALHLGAPLDEARLVRYSGALLGHGRPGEALALPVLEASGPAAFQRALAYHRLGELDKAAFWANRARVLGMGEVAEILCAIIDKESRRERRIHSARRNLPPILMGCGVTIVYGLCVLATARGLGKIFDIISRRHKKRK